MPPAPRGSHRTPAAQPSAGLEVTQPAHALLGLWAAAELAEDPLGDPLELDLLIGGQQREDGLQIRLPLALYPTGGAAARGGQDQRC